MFDNPYVIFIMGPTASGKTDLAVYLYEKLDCGIISVDSGMIYRGMNIGTAKPDKALLEKVPHRLIDICDPVESYSAARFQEDANREIKIILQQGRVPVLVGGTNLYFHVLERGLSPLPNANYQIRATLAEQARAIGWKGMHERLKRIDPDSASRINENDPQRIQRALEVYETTGKTMTALFADKDKRGFSYLVKKIVLAPGDRQILHKRIESRFLRMIKQGVVEEVMSLYRRGDLSLQFTSMRLVGYRQIWHHLDGRSSFEEMQEQVVIATRQLAKRQMTWCRSETGAEWYDSLEKGVFSRILEKIRKL